jgi:hypothetical protein
MGSTGRRWSSRIGRVLACAALTLGVAAVPAVAQPYTWSRSTPLTLASNPAVGEAETVLFGVSCTSVGSCASVGAAGKEIALVPFESSLTPDAMIVLKASVRPAAAAEEGGSWNEGVALEAPAGAEAHKALLRSISCAAPGQCVAVGGYKPQGSEEVQPFAVVETGGKWSQPAPIALPPNAEGKQQAMLESVSCVAGGVCTAVGSYDRKGEAITPMAISESTGVWGAATEVAGGPAGASGSYLKSVSCVAAGSCSAVGTSEMGANGAVAIAASESGGSWSPATEVQTPAINAEAMSAFLDSISCSASGVCVAVGSEVAKYGEVSTEARLIVAEETGGVWGAAKQLGGPRPSIELLPPTLNSVSCWSKGDCAAVGFAADFSLAEYATPLVASEVDGSWTLEEARPPEGALLVSDLDALSCVSDGWCLGTGLYITGEEEVKSSTYSGGSVVTGRM